MPTLIHKLASTALYNHLRQQPMLLTPFPRPQLCDHPCRILSHPYHDYAPAVPYRYAPDTANHLYASTPPPFTMLTLPQRPQNMTQTPPHA
ncbi:hypothetical protein O181_000314 [Austropuccinia psidii MF-1]|uniref:Uncharacterized protein n=1 Tax=Austropuccinia psidii MF-1 TaxID=1389203 RepID=A0A9Q3GAT6_9BASI|nr:hypothetical protein [Austropuccinia psidii MF-1]